MGKAVVLFAAAYFVGRLVLPAMFAVVARLRSRELFLLAVVLAVIGTTVGLAALGLPPALGAYLAGVAVSRSHYSRQVLAELVPSRDLFASLFFVSVGMLVDPMLMWHSPGTLLAVLAVITIVKPAIVALVVRVFGYPASTAIRTGLLLAHVGELSFVLASLGAKRGFISAELYGLVLGGALISILLNPVVLRYGAPALLRRFERAPAAPPAWEGSATGLSRFSDHAVIAGCGRVGSELARQLRLHGLPYVVIELNPIRVEELRWAGEPCLFGDASNLHILRDAGIERAKLLAITHYDVASERTIKELLQHHPSLKVIARAHYPGDLQRLRRARASEVVMPEFEAGMEFLRWTLRHLGLSAAEVERVIQRRRSELQSSLPTGYGARQAFSMLLRTVGELPFSA